MTFTSFETILYQHLTPFFDRHGFVLLPEKKQYRRTLATGYQTIMLSFGFYNDETLLDVSVGCRNEQVEQIAQQFLTNRVIYHHEAITVSIAINQFNDFPFVRFPIQTEQELLNACRQIERFFDITGFTFLTSSCALPGLDQLINEHPDHPCQYVSNQLHRFYKGLITARLTRNKHFDRLIDRYRHSLVKQTQSHYEQIQFERLIAYLRYYSAN